jgi:hypothetical protein
MGATLIQHIFNTYSEEGGMGAEMDKNPWVLSRFSTGNAPIYTAGALRPFRQARDEYYEYMAGNVFNC